MSASPLRILVIDQDPLRAALIEEGLREAGHLEVIIIGEVAGLMRRIADIAPDVIVIDLKNPNRDLVEHMFRISRLTEKPVAMFVDRSDPMMLTAAIEAGVSAYVVDGLRKERVAGILDMAIARFKAYSDLRRTLRQTQEALEDRKAIDQAKAILMRARGLSETESYSLIRTQAMQAGRRMGDIARALILAETMMGGGGGTAT